MATELKTNDNDPAMEQLRQELNTALSERDAAISGRQANWDAFMDANGAKDAALTRVGQLINEVNELKEKLRLCAKQALIACLALEDIAA